ncbi:MAG: adenylyltransferase/cytidyltransferase family protein [Candidatus Diapherotrites archaeon]|nr:adenylyltransferase/cytidyltransferase family protein [Candidatus Diapherotrites archaeon]
MHKKEVIVVASGYFDPIHAGHVEYLEKAKDLGTKLIVIINNREQAILKKGYEFMPLAERMKIVKALKCVDEVIASIDTNAAVCKSLELIKPNIFAKGGDRFSTEIPESGTCKTHGIKIIDGLGEKIQSSSELVKKQNKTSFDIK